MAQNIEHVMIGAGLGVTGEDIASYDIDRANGYLVEQAKSNPLMASLYAA